MTHLVLVIDNPYSQSNPWISGLYVGIIGIVETVGNWMLMGIMNYEKYGMDSMKRTVSNQLWYFLIMTLIIYNLLGLPILLWRVVIGPIGT